MSPSLFNIHQVVFGELSVSISLHLRKNNIGRIIIGPFDVHFSKHNIFEPDIIFVKNENLKNIRENGLFGAPDLVIEILSPATSNFDLEEKKIIYEIYGVSEYFVVEPDSKFVTSFYLKNGEYEEQESVKGKIQSTVLNAEIKF